MEKIFLFPFSLVRKFENFSIGTEERKMSSFQKNELMENLSEWRMCQGKMVININTKKQINENPLLKDVHDFNLLFFKKMKDNMGFEVFRGNPVGEPIFIGEGIRGWSPVTGIRENQKEKAIKSQKIGWLYKKYNLKKLFNEFFEGVDDHIGLYGIANKEENSKISIRKKLAKKILSLKTNIDKMKNINHATGMIKNSFREELINNMNIVNVKDLAGTFFNEKNTSEEITNKAERIKEILGEKKRKSFKEKILLSSAETIIRYEWTNNIEEDKELLKDVITDDLFNEQYKGKLNFYIINEHPIDPKYFSFVSDKLCDENSLPSRQSMNVMCGLFVHNVLAKQEKKEIGECPYLITNKRINMAA